eukprot:4333679-Prymnesium_polylepis.1
MVISSRRLSLHVIAPACSAFICARSARTEPRERAASWLLWPAGSMVASGGTLSMRGKRTPAC